MNVKQLIKELQKCDPSKEICIWDSENNRTLLISSILDEDEDVNLCVYETD